MTREPIIENLAGVINSMSAFVFASCLVEWLDADEVESLMEFLNEKLQDEPEPEPIIEPAQSAPFEVTPKELDAAREECQAIEQTQSLGNAADWCAGSPFAYVNDVGRMGLVSASEKIMNEAADSGIDLDQGELKAALVAIVKEHIADLPKWEVYEGSTLIDTSDADTAEAALEDVYGGPHPDGVAAFPNPEIAHLLGALER